MISSVIFGFSLLVLSQARVFEWDPFIPRIVNGEDAKVGEFPYQVSLQRAKTSSHFCGGSVLNNNYVITAAHCVVYQVPSDIKVIAGTLKLSSPKSTYEVENITVHQKYSAEDLWKNDIALVKIKIPFVLGDNIKVIPLPKASQVIAANQKAVVSGWGILFMGGYIPDHLQRVDLKIADQDFCASVYNDEYHTIHDSQVCAYDPDVEKGSCNGDSGGPLTVDGKLIGLVSWANGCAQIDYPTVFTRVSEFLDWIEANAI